MEFSELKKQIVEKIKELSKFLGSAQMAISFEGRTLTEEQQREVLDIIAEYSDLHVTVHFPANMSSICRSITVWYDDCNTNFWI